MRIDALPKQTHAIIVGAETYATPLWKLVGPGTDGVVFAEWLCGRKVPPENIHLFLSLLDPDDAALKARLAAKRLVIKAPAERDPIRKMFTQILPRLEGQLLFLFWGGHGVVKDLDARRLFYATASDENPDSLDFSSLRRMFRSDKVKIRRQVAFIDACANYYESMRLALQTAGDQMPYTNTEPPVEQFFVFAAASGQATKNDAVRKTGAFSTFVNEWLKNDKTEDLDVMLPGLDAHFNNLRAQRETRQTPVYYIVEAGNNVKESGSVPQSEVVQVAAERWNFSMEQMESLVSAICTCPSMQERAKRDALLEKLDPAIRNVTFRNDDARTDLLNFLSVSLQDKASLEALWRGLALIEPNSYAVQAVREKADRLILTAEVRAVLEDARVRVTSNARFRAYMASSTDVQRSARVSDLDGMIESLSEMANGPGGVSRVAEFVARLHRMSKDPDLNAWLDGQLDGYQRTDLENRLAAEEEMARTMPPFLVLDVRMKTATISTKGEPELVEAWLYNAPNDLADHWLGAELAAKTFRQALSEVILTVRAARGTDLLVEFLLPRELLCMDAECLEVDSEFSSPVPIGIDHPVVLRWRDRFRNPRAAQPGFWRGKVEEIQQRIKANLEPSFLWIDQREQEPILLRAELAKSGCGDCVGLLFVPPENPIDMRRDLLVSALAGGTAHLVWSRRAPADWNDLRARVQNLIRARGFDAFPRLLRDERVEAFKNRKNGLSHPFENVSVIWDLPEHTPVIRRLTPPGQRI
jgi:hypothetical protein